MYKLKKIDIIKDSHSTIVNFETFSNESTVNLALILTDNENQYTFKKFDQNFECKSSFKLTSEPKAFDINGSFGVFGYSELNTHNIEIIHLDSSHVVNKIDLETSAKVNGSKTTSGQIHLVKFYKNFNILVGRYGTSNIQIFDPNGNFIKFLNLDFNTSVAALPCIVKGSEKQTSKLLAIGGFENKIDIFYDLVFKSHSFYL